MRDLLRRTALLGMALGIAVLSGFVLDLHQMTFPRPRVSSDAPCQHRPSAILNDPDSIRACHWPDAMEPSPVRFDIQETSDGSMQVKASVSLPAKSATVRQVERGEAASDPTLFVNQVFGFIGRDRFPLAWTVPVVVITAPKAHSGSTAQRVTITSTGTESPEVRKALSSVNLTLSNDSSPTGTVTVATNRKVIAGHNGLTPARQDAHHLTAQISAGSWRVLLTPATPPHQAGPLTSDLAPPSWWKGTETVLSSAWQAARTMVPAFLAAVPWAVLLLVGRAGPYRLPWRNFLAMAGLLLTWHFVLTVAGATQQIDFELNNVLIQFAVDNTLSVLDWDPMYGVSEAGSLVILIAALLSVLPVAVRRAPAVGAAWPRPKYGDRRVLAAAAGVGVFFYAEILIELRDPERTASMPLVLVQAGALVFLGVGAWGVARLWRKLCRRGGPPLPPLGTLVALALILNAVAPLGSFGGYLPWLVRWGVVLGTGGAALLALAQLTARELGQLGTPGRGRQGLPRWARPVATLCALGLVVPWDLRVETGQGWFHLLSFTQALDGLLAQLAVVSGLIALRLLGGTPVSSAPELRRHLVAGRGSALIVLTSSYTFFHPSSAWALGAAATGVWLLLPSAGIPLAAHTLGQQANDRHRAVSLTASSGAARRQLPGARKHQRDQDGTAQEARNRARRIRTLELIATLDGRSRTHLTPPQPTPQQTAFGSFVSRRPWLRAKSCALAGAAFGLPWTVLDLVGSADLHPGGPYPLLIAVGTLLPALLRWAGYGFLFGYFFPLLRGRTGLAKALWLSTAAAGPALLELLLTPASAPVWTRMVVSVLQLVTFALTLGLWADRRVLAQYSYHWSRLADIHNLGSLTAWASTVTAALGAGLAALLLVGAQPFVTGLVQPPSLPTPPPATSTSANP
ncbi:hypothetical protein [Streptomyces hokutonensis]|uniref:hypothetical protein n=1 Tax=Streptomyces hokutonensis TaxID=1306990 RepID=UPI0038062DD5